MLEVFLLVNRSDEVMPSEFHGFIRVLWDLNSVVFLHFFEEFWVFFIHFFGPRAIEIKFLFELHLLRHVKSNLRASLLLLKDSWRERRLYYKNPPV